MAQVNLEGFIRAWLRPIGVRTRRAGAGKCFGGDRVAAANTGRDGWTASIALGVCQGWEHFGWTGPLMVRSSKLQP